MVVKWQPSAAQEASLAEAAQLATQQAIDMNLPNFMVLDAGAKARRAMEKELRAQFKLDAAAAKLTVTSKVNTKRKRIASEGEKKAARVNGGGAAQISNYDAEAAEAASMFADTGPMLAAVAAEGSARRR